MLHLLAITSLALTRFNSVSMFILIITVQTYTVNVHTQTGGTKLCILHLSIFFLLALKIKTALQPQINTHKSESKTTFRVWQSLSSAFWLSIKRCFAAMFCGLWFTPLTIIYSCTCSLDFSSLVAGHLLSVSWELALVVETLLYAYKFS